jgi:hypothetical protein
VGDTNLDDGQHCVVSHEGKKVRVVKRCLVCKEAGQFSVCAVISTLGVSERQQKCTVSLSFCADCLQAICANTEGNAVLRVQEALQAGFQALTVVCTEQCDRPDGASDKKAGCSIRHQRRASS